MGKHVISASGLGRERAIRYFRRYSADPDRSVPQWTQELHQARWLDDDEIGAEVAMLAALCPGDEIASEPLGASSN